MPDSVKDYDYYVALAQEKLGRTFEGGVPKTLADILVVSALMVKDIHGLPDPTPEELAKQELDPEEEAAIARYLDKIFPIDVGK